MSNQSYFFNPRDDRMTCAGSGLQYPRLDTSSRLAMNVTTMDAGLMVFDLTLREMFIWNGTAWRQVIRDEGIVQTDKFVVEFAAIETNPQAAQADRFVVEFVAVETTGLGAQADRFVVEFAAVETTDLGAQLDKLTVTMIAMEL
jgi:hypothetical protein